MKWLPYRLTGLFFFTGKVINIEESVTLLQPTETSEKRRPSYHRHIVYSRRNSKHQMERASELCWTLPIKHSAGKGHISERFSRTKTPGTLLPVQVLRITCYLFVLVPAEGIPWTSRARMPTGATGQGASTTRFGTHCLDTVNFKTVRSFKIPSCFQVGCLRRELMTLKRNRRWGGRNCDKASDDCFP